MSKPTVYIYLNEKAASTVTLSKHLAKHIDDLNNLLLIHFIYITKNNSEKVKQKGIRKTPTLIYENRRFEGLEKIIQVLTPPQRNKESYGYGVTNPDEMLHKWQDEIIQNHADDDQEEALGDTIGDTEIRDKMAAFQKKRPKMSDNVSQKQKIPGGRLVKGKSNQKEYHGDDDFLKDSGVNNQDQTPTSQYTEDVDGELLLEDYYLEEAYASGLKKHSNKPVRKPRY